MGTPVKIYSMGHAGIEELVTQAAHLMIDHLCNKKLITEEIRDNLLVTKQILIRRNSALTRLWKKYCDKDQDENSIGNMYVATIEDILVKKGTEIENL